MGNGDDGNNVVDKDNDNYIEGHIDYMNASHDGNDVSGNDIWIMVIITVRLVGDTENSDNIVSIIILTLIDLLVRHKIYVLL